MVTTTSKAKRKKAADRPKASGQSLAFRSRITNGSTLSGDVDLRSAWARRYRDLIELHTNDKGGEEHVSEAEKALIRRSACLILELERSEARFAMKGGASADDMLAYQRCVNTLRRTLEALGVQRRPRPKDMTATVLEAMRTGHDQYGASG